MLTCAFGGCGDTDSGNEGDCVARIEYQGATYRPHNSVKKSAPTSEELGQGDVVGCDGEPVDQVAVHRIRGVEQGTGVAVVDSTWQGLYVLEGSTPEDWPSIRTGG